MFIDQFYGYLFEKRFVFFKSLLHEDSFDLKLGVSCVMTCLNRGYSQIVGTLGLGSLCFYNLYLL
mgnify:CR=1 FL=1